jgi:hypothetical protein
MKEIRGVVSRLNITLKLIKNSGKISFMYCDRKAKERDKILSDLISKTNNLAGLAYSLLVLAISGRNLLLMNVSKSYVNILLYLFYMFFISSFSFPCF